MRVLMLSTDYGSAARSGIGVAVADQAAALTELGVAVTVLTMKPPAEAGSGRPGFGPTILTPGRRRLGLDPNDFDCVHLHSLPFAELALELCRRFRLPLIYTAHTLVHRELRASPLVGAWRRLQELVLERADRVVFLSSVDLEAALSRWPWLGDRSARVPNGLPEPPADPGPGEEPLVSFAGRFAHSKGLDLLEKVVPALIDRFGVRCEIAGGHGDREGRRAVEALVARRPGSCRLRGWLGRTDLEQLLARSALVLAPSRYEPFGLVALEAMRMGAPVLVSDVGGFRDTVTDGSGGRRVRGRDPASWREEASAILADPGLRRRLRRRGPRHVRRFGSQACARRLREVYLGA